MRLLTCLLGVICLCAASAAQADMTATKSLFGVYSPGGSADDRQVDLNTAVANHNAAQGTLYMPGTSVSSSLTNIGNMNTISVQNSDGTVTIKNVTDQDNKIGSQEGTIKIITNDNK